MTDYIDREAFERLCMFDPDIQDMQDVIYALRDYPAADVRPVVRGEWMYDEDSCELSGEDSIKCSICGNEYVLDEWGMDDFTNLMKFCPNCGVDMRKENE